MTKYVELKTAIDAVNNVYYDTPDINLSADKLEAALLGIPSADVVPVVHGRWEPYFEEVEIYNAGGVAERKQTGWICGRCKSVESITRYYKTNYCPNCGAKMDLEALQ